MKGAWISTSVEIHTLVEHIAPLRNTKFELEFFQSLHRLLESDISSLLSMVVLPVVVLGVQSLLIGLDVPK